MGDFEIARLLGFAQYLIILNKITDALDGLTKFAINTFRRIQSPAVGHLPVTESPGALEDESRITATGTEPYLIRF